MTALAAIQAAGLTVQVDGSRLLVSPRERLTDDLRTLIRQHKDELLTELRHTPPDLERRRSRVIAALQADPMLRYSFDVQGASVTGPAPSDVSVMLGLRDANGTIIAGELRVPAHKWPGLAVFIAFWKEASERKPS